MTELILIGAITLVTLWMLAARKLSALIILFAFQSGILFLISARDGFDAKNTSLIVVSFLVLIIKAIGIPLVLRGIIKKIQVPDLLGMFIKPFVSVVLGILLAAVAWGFVGWYLPFKGGEAVSISAALMIMLCGMFLMIFRMQALAQVIGLLAMENGIFLAGAALSGSVPFFIEIAVAFDIFMCVIILGVFIYRINSLFTHIDVNKLTRLKG